ncbi:bifunctional metallophosphatase/5'-nucleotidase [Roseateles sp. BYS180W]|uniref:Bifunctional metallophosphatase/5'-nucleotidase n=1 Tax=Roseateles rivi TaxID=3299028 RepID=A0ABW7FSH9_9BURK
MEKTSPAARPSPAHHAARVRPASAWQRALPLALAVLLSACASVPEPKTAATPAPLQLKLLAINDFHGNLQAPTGGLRMPDAERPGHWVSVPAGGAEHLATAVAQLKAKNPNHLFVAAGDLIGASPLLSSLFHDEPTIESLSLMGLDLAAVGNHEFDHGLAELLRKQNGGCHPQQGCSGPQPFAGARFQYLAASTRYADSGKTVLPAYAVRHFEGVPVGVIGLTLKGTPGVSLAENMVGLRFEDEADTVNALVPLLQRQGVQAFVVLVHEGGETSGGPNECPDLSGAIVNIVQRLHPAVDVVISGHTHRAYSCQLQGKLLTSGSPYGAMLTEIDLQLDRKSGEVLQAKAHNLVVKREQFAKDPQQTALIARYEALAAPKMQRRVGHISAPFSREQDAAGSSALGLLVADAALAATQAPQSGGAHIAFTNPGGLRADLLPREDGSVSFGDIYSVQPFGNKLLTLELSGAELLEVLEQQWRTDRFVPLQPSKGLRYTWDAQRPIGQRVLPGSVFIQDSPLQQSQRYRVTVNNFLAGGGDGFTLLQRAKVLSQGPQDVAALEALLSQGPQAPSPAERMRKLGAR